jgi:hypothetical protein
MTFELSQLAMSVANLHTYQKTVPQSEKKREKKRGGANELSRWGQPQKRGRKSEGKNE